MRGNGSYKKEAVYMCFKQFQGVRENIEITSAAVIRAS